MLNSFKNGSVYARNRSYLQPFLVISFCLKAGAWVALLYQVSGGESSWAVKKNFNWSIGILSLLSWNYKYILGKKKVLVTLKCRDGQIETRKKNRKEYSAECDGWLCFANNIIALWVNQFWLPLECKQSVCTILAVKRMLVAAAPWVFHSPLTRLHTYGLSIHKCSYSNSPANHYQENGNSNFVIYV